MAPKKRRPRPPRTGKKSGFKHPFPGMPKSGGPYSTRIPKPGTLKKRPKSK